MCAHMYMYICVYVYSCPLFAYYNNFYVPSRKDTGLSWEPVLPQPHPPRLHSLLCVYLPYTVHHYIVYWSFSPRKRDRGLVFLFLYP